MRGSALAETPPQRVSADKGAAKKAVHILEDALLGAALVAITLEDRIPRDIVLDVVRTLLDARRDGRVEEFQISAHSEAASLPEWHCSRCGKANPGTFEVERGSIVRRRHRDDQQGVPSPRVAVAS